MRRAGWTVDTLKAYVDMRFTLRDAHMDERHEASQRAIITALGAINERLGSMNEFRGALRDQAGTFATRAEVDILQAHDDRRLGANAGLASIMGYVVGLIGVAGIIYTAIRGAGQ